MSVSSGASIAASLPKPLAVVRRQRTISSTESTPDSPKSKMPNL
jgi:hypothetical protein